MVIEIFCNLKHDVKQQLKERERERERERAITNLKFDIKELELT